MERKIRKNSGITLITLIVTIVVMLILVAVSVRVVKNSDLIGVAKQAGKLTEEAKEKEKSGKVTIEGVEYDSIEDYVYGEAPKVTATTYGKNITLSVYDLYINYVANKSKEEKEQIYAEREGYTDIDTLINEKYNGNRKEYEAYMISSMYYYKTYEKALENCIDWSLRDEFHHKYLGTVGFYLWDDIYENVRNLSITEKEESYANDKGYWKTEEKTAIEELMEVNSMDKKMLESVIMSEYPTDDTYNEALTSFYMHEVLDLSSPNAETVFFHTTSFTHTFENLPYGTYTFTAYYWLTGRNRKITVTTKKETGTFTIEYNGEILGSFEFEKGQSIEEYIVSLCALKKDDGYYYKLTNDVTCKVYKYSVSCYFGDEYIGDLERESQDIYSEYIEDGETYNIIDTSDMPC